MRRFAGSHAYARARVVTGSLFVLFGATVVVRTFMVVGMHSSAIGPLVMGFALLGLGALRVRDYVVFRRSRA